MKMGLVLKGYFIFPCVFAALLLALFVVLCFVNGRIAFWMGLFFLVYLVALFIFFSINNDRLEKGLVRFAKEYGGLEGELISNFPLPYVVTDPDGAILAYNKIFSRIYDETAGRDNVCQIFREVTAEDFSFEGDTNNISVVYDNRNYRLCIKRIPVTNELIDGKIALLTRHNFTIYAFYLIDETEIVSMVKKGVEDQIVIGSISIDNYEEITKHSLDVKNSMAAALVDQEIGNYFSAVGGVVRKLEKDSYFVIFKRKYLQSLQRSKFEILDKIKKLDIGDDLQVTVSLGFGVGSEYAQVADAAGAALELAQGRGGDQAVLKEGERTYFYGGKTKQAEKNTRVRARVMAQNIKECFAEKDRIVVMGHKNADIDCFGAALGICNTARSMGKRSYIIVGNQADSVAPFMDAAKQDENYRQGVFITPEQAEAYVNEGTALVIVDVNKSDIFECPELVEKTDMVIMIDHHLQSGDKIENLTLQYVEPTASSACEMVTELLQYFSENQHILRIEAESLYAGILIDTDSFTNNTGVKTFEAAAYLKKCGVDVQKVQGRFSDSLETARLKAAAMAAAEQISEGFVMTVSPTEGVANPSVVAAQVANELMDIQGIKASFVLTLVGDVVHISARSEGDTNVQLVMERLGGGGHLNMAGAQLSETNIEDAKKVLKATIKKMLDEGDIS